jgi:hypothetical protein
MISILALLGTGRYGLRPRVISRQALRGGRHRLDPPSRVAYLGNCHRVCAFAELGGHDDLRRRSLCLLKFA